MMQEMRHPQKRVVVYGRMRPTIQWLVAFLLLITGPEGSVPDMMAADELVLAGSDPALSRPLLKRRATSRVKRSNNTYGSHYFLSFSAIPLRKQQGFYKNTMVSLNSVAYGLTEHLSVAGSLDLVSLIRARAGGPVYSGRLQVGGRVSDLVHIGASATYLNTRIPVGVTVPEGTEVAPGFTTGLAMLTIGSMNNQITLAGGVMHDGNDFGRGPVLNVGGGVRVFANVMFITENWLFSDPDRSFSAHSFGIRIIGDELAIDLGVAYDKEYTKKITAIGLPFLSATLNF